MSPSDKFKPNKSKKNPDDRKNKDINDETNQNNDNNNSSYQNINNKRKNSISIPFYYRGKTLVIVTIVLISLLISDTALEKITDLIGASEMYSTNIREFIFIFIFIFAFIICQFFLLSFTGHKIKTITIYLKRLKKDKPNKSASSLFHSFKTVSQLSSPPAATSQSLKKFNKTSFFNHTFFFNFFSAGNFIHKTVLLAQFSLLAILIIVSIFLYVESYYPTFLLNLSTSISYILAIGLVSLLTRYFFRWIVSSSSYNRNLVVISYGIASAFLSVNLFFSLAFMFEILIYKPDSIMEHFTTAWPVFDPNSLMGILNSSFILSGILSFIGMWASTALLLKHYSKRIGKIKYWTIIAIPLVYFLSQFALSPFLTQQIVPIMNTDPIMTGLILTLIFTISKPAGGILFGVAFWVIARSLKDNAIVQDYMRISAIGIVLLFVSTQGSVINTSYPPFGLVTVSLVGLSSYMMFIGLYSIATSVSQDIRLRQIIRSSVKKEHMKLVDSIATAQMEYQLQEKVFKITKANSTILEESSGVKSSIGEDEIKEHIKMVMDERKKEGII